MINLQQKPHAIRVTLALLLIFSLLMFEALSAETRYRVRSSDNVNTIIDRYYPNSGLSRGQLLIGILIENPRAFKGGNVNFLLRGRRLTLPNESDFQQISPEKASELLSEHARFFRFGLAGDLPIPTLSEMRGTSEELNESNNILVKQTNQTKQIDQLQQESNELKKQLEALLNEKTNRDLRLLELEKSLNQSLNTSKKLSESGTSAKALGLEKSNKLLQKKLNKTKSELAENSKSNIDLERKVESLKEVLDEKNITGGKADQIILEPSTNILSKLIWLLPLLLLGLFLFYIFGKKRQAQQVDNIVKVNEAGFIEPSGVTVEEFQENIDETEESSLETSVKLDVARAYIEADDTQSALDILTEIMEEGSDEQRQQAHDLLETISPK